jgi:hypothetical protein
VLCWGQNDYGQLGQGNTTNIGDNETPDTIPTVNLGPGRTATAITTGDAHTCATLDTDEVLCWGQNNIGQLGQGNTTNIGDNETPDTIPTVNLGLGRTATAITAGAAHTCAILDTDEVLCWGSNSSGERGAGIDGVIGDTESPGDMPAIQTGPKLPPIVTDGVSSSGSGEENMALACSGGSFWYDSNTEYRWYRDNSEISGAVSSSYVVQHADDGTVLTCRAAGSNASGTALTDPSTGIAANTAPTLPILQSTSHDVGPGVSKNPQLQVQWTGSSDRHGVAGYAVTLSTGPSDTPEPVVTTSQTSGTFLPGSGTWYVHIRAQDNTGRWNAVSHLGPITIDDSISNDTTAPTVTLRSGTKSSRGKLFTSKKRIRFAISDSGGGAVSAQGRVGKKLLPMSSDGYLNIRKLRDGRHRLVVVATDEAGNTRSKRVTITVDRTAPTLKSWTRHTTGPKFRARFSDNKGVGSVRSKQLSRLTMNSTHVRMRVRDRLGNSRTVTIPVTRHISLSKMWFNSDSQRTLGFRADDQSINAAFQYLGPVAPWYSFAQRRNPLIAEVQRRLQLLGFSPSLRITGMLDMPTLVAIKRFQRSNGIEDIGTVGPRTRAALDRALGRYMHRQRPS